MGDTYLAFHDERADKVGKIAETYAKMSLPEGAKQKWMDVVEQLANRTDPSKSDAMFLKSQEEQRLKSMQPHLDFFCEEDHTIVIEHRNLSAITINFYRTELELMFSMYPFQDENVSYKLMLP